MTEEQRNYRFRRILALAYISEMLGSSSGMNAVQADTLIERTSEIFDEFKSDKEAAESIRDLAQEMYAELDETYTEGDVKNG